MSVIAIIAIVVAALIILALVAVYVRRRAERRQILRQRLASEATGHRQEADAHATRAQELGPEASALRRGATEQAAFAEREAARVVAYPGGFLQSLQALAQLLEHGH